MKNDLKEIRERMALRALEVAQMLLPGGKEERGLWVCGDISGGPGKTFQVKVSGPYAGHYSEWADQGAQDWTGDMIDLWRVAKGLTPGEAIRECKEFLGIREPEKAQATAYKQAPRGSHLVNPNPEGRAYRWLTEKRRMRRETLELYQVKVLPAANGDPAAIVFPCISATGEILNRSYRTLPSGDEKKRVWQDKGCAPAMFGWQAVPQSAYRERRIIITEGQIDAMTWHQWGFAAISVPAGTGLTWIEYEWENLEAFETIFLSLDSDKAGEANRKRIVERLGPHRCMIVNLPKKDANDCLQAGMTSAHAKSWIEEAQPVPVAGLVTAAELRFRVAERLRPKPAAFTLPMFSIRWPDEGLYFRPEEVTLWTGVSSHGKSTFLNFLVLRALSEDIPVFLASMEMPACNLLLRMIKTSYASIRLDFCDTATDDFLARFGHLLVFADVIGYIDQDSLLSMMEYSFRRFGTQHFVIDSLMRIEGLEEEYAEQGKFMNRLQHFAKKTNTHIHMVAHPRKVGPGGRPSLMDVKGSSLIPNNADNIVAVVRNTAKLQAEKDGAMTAEIAAQHDTEIVVEKQRDTGWAGNFKLKFDPSTYLFTSFKK